MSEVQSFEPYTTMTREELLSHVQSNMSDKRYQHCLRVERKVLELAKNEELTILCGHYEGIDQRVLDEIVDEEISIGNYVLTGGEIPAMVLIDSVSRYVEGVLSEGSTNEESFSKNNLLEYPQYTRPYEFMERKIPDVLISGNHQKIDEWRKQQSLINTYKKRPELLTSEQKNLIDFESWNQI